MCIRASAKAAKVPHLARAALVAGAVCWGWAEPARADLTWEALPPGVTIQEIQEGVWRIESIHGATIVNYSEFNLFLNQEARFLLPDSSSRILNRVNQLDPSVINGLIRSNGIVYLVNPAGVVFDGNAVVDVAGFYAAAGDITDSDFLAGRDRFFLDGDVTVNAGAELQAIGNLHLLGNHVANHGTITSEGGVISMLAGDKVILSEIGGRLMVTVDGIQLTDRDAPYNGRNGDRVGTPAVENTGVIRSERGRVILGAGDLASLAIRNAGSISAAGGEVELVANGGLIWNDDGGSISTSDGAGLAGNILVRAPRIEFDHGARVTGYDVFMDADRLVGLMNPIDLVHDLTLRSGSLITVGNTIDISGNAAMSARDINLSGGTITTGGSQTFTGDVWLGRDTVLTGTEIVFNDRVNSESSDLSPRRSLVVNGNASFFGAVGAGYRGNRLQSLTVNGNTLIAGGIVATLDFQKYLGATTLGADALLFSDRAGLIQFGGTLDGAFGLDVRTAGRTRFDGVVGAGEALTYVVTDAPGDTKISADMTAGTMTFGDAVKLGASAKLTGTDSVSFLQTVSGNGYDLKIKSPLTFFGDDATGFGKLKTDAAGETIVDAARITGEKIHFGDQVTMNEDVSVRGRDYVKFDGTLDADVSGEVDLFVKSDRLIELGDNVGGETAFSTIELRSGRRDVVRDNVIVIDGRLIRATNDINLNPQGKSEPGLVATIASNDDVKIKSIDGDVFTGVNEKITSLGDLTLVAKNGSVTVTDLNAVGRIAVAAEDIFIRRRLPGRLFDYNGFLLGDQGTDVIAIRGISGSTTPTFIGQGLDPVFATGLEAVVRLLLPAIILNELRPELFTLNPILDLSSGGATRGQDIASAFDDDTALQVGDTVKLDAIALRQLEQLGLELRPMTDAELVSATSGRELYNDAPRGGMTRDAGMVITANRLRRDSMIRVVDQYSNLFLREAMNPVTGERFQEDQSTTIREAVTQAWDAYVAETGDDPPTAEGFRRYLELTPDHVAALNYLDGIGDLFQEIWTMGATPRELRMCTDGVLGNVCPTDMDQSDLEQVIGLDALLG